MPTLDINNKKIEVEQIRNDWALALMTKGVIVKLSMKRWGAKGKLTPEALGLKFVDEGSYSFFKQYLQKLLPPREMTDIVAIERLARLSLANYSFETVWGRFLPFTAFDEWQKENAEFKTEYYNLAKSIGSRYDSILVKVKEEYRNMAKDVWARLYPQDKNNPTPAFIEDFVQKIIEKIPPREEIVASFRYNVTYFTIPLPALIESNIAKAEEIKLRREMAKFDSEIEKEAKRRISEEYIEKQKDLIDGFLESTVISMRAYVADLCDGVLRSIGQRSKGKITEQSVNRIKSLIKKVKLLNFYNDKEITNILKDLENEANKFKGEYNKDVIVEKLREIVEVGKKEFVPENFNPSISVLEVDET
jgi:hypothetical protein